MTSSKKQPSAMEPDPAAEKAARARQAKRSLLRFLFTFLALAGLSYVLYNPAILQGTPLFPPLVGAIDGFTGLIAQAACGVLNLLGGDVQVSGTRLFSAEGGVNIRRGCDALLPTALFLSAVIAFPSPFWPKIWGATAGILLLQCINLLRVITLFYLQAHGSEWIFEVMHEDVWQLIFIALAMVCFMFWIRLATPLARRASP
jgi:exosortase/archaeosortase family protein